MNHFSPEGAEEKDEISFVFVYNAMKVILT
jgi:hypothetical protein